MMQDSSAPIAALHYAYPLITLLYFAGASLVSICTLQTLKLKVKDQHIRRDVILWLKLGVTCEYLLQALLLTIRAWIRNGWFPDQDEMVYLISSGVVWAVQMILLADSKFPVWHPYYVNWIIAILFEIILVVVTRIYQPIEDVFDIISVSIQSLRACNIILLPCMYLALRNRTATYEVFDPEREALLGSPDAAPIPANDTPKYGATTPADDDADSIIDDENDSYLRQRREDKERVAKRLEQDGNWWTYAKAFTIFFPYIWPTNNRALQLRMILIWLCILTKNFMNVLVPRQLGTVVDSTNTARASGDGHSTWIAVALFAALTFARSDACVGGIQWVLQQPIEQYQYAALNNAALSHVMSLSSDFHENKEPSQIYAALFRGRAVTGLLDIILYDVVPMFIDLFLVFWYLYYLFGPYMALILAVTTVLYLYWTTNLVARSQVHRRPYVYYFGKEWKSAYQSLGNWTMASYFNNIPYEEQRYASAVNKYQKYNRLHSIGTRLVSAAQGLIIAIGLLGACFLAVYQVIQKSRSPGDFVVLLTYWGQLQGPLSKFSAMFRKVNEMLMDTERLLEIFQTKPTICDSDDAKPLTLTKGEIRFNNIEFGYDARKTILKGVNFRVAGGSSVAVVGETGGGKSTILKVLNRFYDVSGGSIEIDGQNIRHVTLRR
jgi:ABC-type multidrug transport system fused ATPase/permease subunit